MWWVTKFVQDLTGTSATEFHQPLSRTIAHEERQRKGGEFAFERPEQIQILSTCQGQSAHNSFTSCRIVLCCCTRKKIWNKEPPRTRRGPDRTPSPRSPSQRNRVLVGTWGSSWYMSERSQCASHVPRNAEPKGSHQQTQQRSAFAIYQVEEFLLPREIKSSGRNLFNVGNPARAVFLFCVPHGEWYYLEPRKIWVNESAVPRPLFSM